MDLLIQKTLKVKSSVTKRDNAYSVPRLTIINQLKKQNMKFEVYDKAKWHYESKDMPKDLPAIAGATHIAFFVRWCVENDLMSREIEEDCAEELLQIKNKELDCRDFFFDDMDGVLTSD